jgi:predicted nucleic acid-binding protein
VYILDTNILNVLFHDNPANQESLRNRLAEIADDDVWVSVVTVYEILIKGIVPTFRDRLNTPQAVLAFKALSDFLEDLSDFQILPYTEQDDERFLALPARIRQQQGPNDCRIAASAVSNDYTVITRNARDFEGTGARCENWIDNPAA